MLYQANSISSVSPVFNAKTNQIKSICIKNNKLESIAVNNRKADVIQMVKVLRELMLMSVGLADLRKYEGIIKVRNEE